MEEEDRINNENSTHTKDSKRQWKQMITEKMEL